MNDINDPMTRVIGNGFRGYFDGQNHTINLTINTNGDAALFGLIGGICSGGSSYIKNLIVSGDVNLKSATAGITTHILACGLTVEISNCINLAKITGSDNGNIARTGGIAGMLQGNNVTISHCINVGNIKSGCAAGIVGLAEFLSDANIYINNCINYGYIKGGSYAAGILGLVFYYGGNSSIQNCVNTGVVEGAYYNGCILARSSGSGALPPIINCW